MENVMCELIKCMLSVGYVEAITEVREVRRHWYWVRMSAKCNSKKLYIYIYTHTYVYIYIPNMHILSQACH